MQGGLTVLGPKQKAQGALFYAFSIDDHVPQDHRLRSIDRFVLWFPWVVATF